MKLLWLADRVHLNKHGRLILKDNYNALPNGPVPSTTMDYSKNTISDSYSVKGYNITSTKEFDAQYFSDSDLEVMNFIWEKFGQYNQYQLRDLSHKFPEWLRYEKELNDNSLPNSYNIVMDDFFINPNIERFDDVFSIEKSEISKSHYRSYNAIQSNLNEQCL
ncbi:Panacea domain-containing protein [Flavobacterium sp. ZS1P14]|uniref:Panacea domain-containing protein n=1 Tax=Flavobacterium sp. ZS1P14 TaxID=3401729 RepID=UPI003AAEA605